MKLKIKKKAQATARKKIVKKNTFYRNFRAWLLRLEHRQQNDTPPIVVRDTEQHVCHHCGTEFTGGYCPKCSMPARWKRFNWKLLFLNFMDIWGLGNRPMFRTIRDLFWRPGYMIRDYLHGHHLSYFPPFKMLAVWTVILIFMMWLFKPSVAGAVDVANAADNDSILDFAREEMFDGRLSATSTMLIEKIDLLYNYLDDHMLYSIIVATIFVVIAVKWAFWKVSKYNYVETFISQIYINCQFHILAVASMFFTWKIPDSNELLPYMKGLIWPPIVLVYDFHQLYGVTWKKAIWKTFVVFVNMFILYFMLALMAYGIFTLIEHFAK